MGESYIVVHVGGSQQIDTRVVRPLDLIGIGTVVVGVGTVMELVLRRHDANSLGPVPHPLGPFGVSLVARVLSQARREVEETAVRDGVLVVVAAVERVNLPSEPAIAGLIVPPYGLRIEGGLSKGKPLRFVRWRIWEPILSRR